MSILSLQTRLGFAAWLGQELSSCQRITIFFRKKTRLCRLARPRTIFLISVEPREQREQNDACISYAESRPRSRRHYTAQIVSGVYSLAMADG